MFTLVKKYYPNIIKSGSTQMSVHNKEGVELLSELAMAELFLPEKLSLNEVREINNVKGNTEIEDFWSRERCCCIVTVVSAFMSSLIGKRSGNRGCCAQPCRMDYTFLKDNKVIKKGCIISPKDVSTVEILDKVMSTGTDSLKIEGRMKSPEYVYEVVSQYRKYIDMWIGTIILLVDKNDIKELTQIFNRGGSLSYRVTTIVTQVSL